MQSSNWISRNNVSALLIGTAVIQLSVIGIASILHLNSESSAPTELASSDLGNGPLASLKVEEQTDLMPLEQPAAALEAPIEAAKIATEPEKLSPPAVAPTLELKKHKVSDKETLSSIWKRYGGKFQSSLKAAEALKKTPAGSVTLRAGETIELGLAESGGVSELRKKLRDGKTLIMREMEDGSYQTEVVEADISEEDRVVMGTIRSTFSGAAAEQAVPYPVVDQLVDLFSNRVEFARDIQPGDEFGVIYTERVAADGSEIDPGQILAASLKVNGQIMVAIQHIGADGVPRYFSEDGSPLDRYFLRYPVNFTRISSVFAGSRFHPVLKKARAHNGVDFAAPIGTPVRAVADGRVTLAGWNGGSGKMVKIQHGDRYATAYLHLNSISASVKNGSFVKRGEVIGAVGKTGLATGPHLHFSFYDRAKYVDPLKVQLPTLSIRKEDQISPRYLQAALQTLGRYHEVRGLFAGLTNGVMNQG